LWDIARAHGVGFKQLATWNGLAPGDAIRPGQKLVVWSRQGKAGGVTAVAAGGVQALTRQAIRYTVRPGDSLDRISRKFRVSVKDLRRWNARGLKGRYIHPGQKLTLYLDVTRQAL
jgi:membrane-bound lytic murein transglycosylase D